MVLFDLLEPNPDEVGVDGTILKGNFLASILIGVLLVLPLIVGNVFAPDVVVLGLPGQLLDAQGSPFCVFDPFACIFISSVVAPLVEEFIFRVVFYMFLTRLMPRALAVIVQATAFAFFHFQFYGAGAQGLFTGAFLFGIIAQILTIAVGFPAAAVLHAGFNFFLSASQFIVGGF